MTKQLTPFDFMNAASLTKENLISDNDYPEMIEKEYVPYIVNRGFSNFEDSILHANEMNQRAHLFNAAQFQYYRSVLRKRKRFSKWYKSEKNEDLDAIQQVYMCSRSIAKLYYKALSTDDLKQIKEKLEIGG